MKKAMLLAVVFMFFAGISFADTLQVNINADGSGTISGAIASDNEPGILLINVSGEPGNDTGMVVWGCDSGGDCLAGISYDSGIIETATSMTAAGSIYASISANMEITSLEVNH